jgi:cytochrome c5
MKLILLSKRTAHSWTLAIACCVSALTTLGGACGDDSRNDQDIDAAVEEEGEVGPPSGALCPSDNTLTYENFGKQFVEDYCVRCHSSELAGEKRNGAPKYHDFDSLEGILNVANHVDEKAAAGPDSINTSMPPNGAKPTMAEREKFGQWLQCEVDKL